MTYCKTHDRVHYGCPCPECDPEWFEDAAARAKASEPANPTSTNMDGWLEKLEQRLGNAPGDPGKPVVVPDDELRHLVRIARAAVKVSGASDDRELIRKAAREILDGGGPSEREMWRRHNEDWEGFMAVLRNANLMREKDSSE